MRKKIIYRPFVFLLLLVFATSCKIQEQAVKTENKSVPVQFDGHSGDSTNIGKLNWKEYFGDENLIALIDSALKRNQELNITMQEIAISNNEIRARKGEYLPFVGLRAGAELRNAKKSATLRYLATVEGKNFMVTNLIAEIASSYYELMALDNLLDIVQKNIQIQTDALQIVRQQKEAAKLTQLAVNRFEALVLHTKSLQYDILQRRVETENRINFLTGSFPHTIPRSSAGFNNIGVDSVAAGIPSQLLMNRPDIRQAELQLAAAKLDVKVARANFYPSFRITAGTGFQSFNLAYLITPESMLYNLAGDLMVPLVNRTAIKATYNSANARQAQEVYNYERTILNAYVDVVNQMSKVQNFSRSYETKAQEVDILMRSIDISNSLFKSARADYLEVLLTQREALESKMELIEIKVQQLNGKVNIYKALGGGWN
jgi:outer membrane protein, multidrug efflux system